MHRRHFLQHTGLAAAGACFSYKGYSINPVPQIPFLNALAASGNPSERVLVLVQLIGGNDGLNTFVPLDQMDMMSKVRKNVFIPQNKLLKINGTTKNALHPVMTEFRDLYNAGLVNVVQNVGYPNQDYSHFRSTDIWMSASDSDKLVETGWTGRYLQTLHPDFPTGYPGPENPDPLAIQIGAIVSLTLMGTEVPMGMAISDPQDYYQFVNDVVEDAPDTPYGRELKYIRLVSQQAQVYYESIKAAADKGKNLSNKYPSVGDNYLADQLRIVAQLISGGLRTPVYIVTLDGFDTHNDQADSNTSEGRHADLLRTLSKAVGAFQDDLNKLGVADRVAGMTFSEFGRTIASNGSNGTDHGAAAPLFVFGKNVIPGIIGTNPVIPKETVGSDDLPMQHDFRSIYASALQDWFGIENPENVLQNKFPILPIFKAGATPVKVPPAAAPSISNYPNPFRQSTTFDFSTEGGAVSIQLMDNGGRVLETIAEGQFPAGAHRITFERGNLPAGNYFYQIRVNGRATTRKLLAI
jgi:uncharacterized protein (DUF1501 family)